MVVQTVKASSEILSALSKDVSAPCAETGGTHLEMGEAASSGQEVYAKHVELRQRWRLKLCQQMLKAPRSK